LCETTLNLPIEKFVTIALDEIKNNYKLEWLCHLILKKCLPQQL
jgi:hypothetical protein